MNIILILCVSILYSCTSGTSKHNITELTFNIYEKQNKSSKDFLLGKEEPSSIKDFVLINPKYCMYGNQYIHTEANAAYVEMYEAAAQEGIYLTVLSSYRSYFTQNWLWESNWNKERGNYSSDSACVNQLLHYLAIPGTSRHHWGTEIDILSVSPDYFKHGEGLKVYTWLTENANKFGFYQAYTPNRHIGYNNEPWHWSYKPLSVKFLDDYLSVIAIEDISMAKGVKNYPKDKIINEYILGINPILVP